MSAISKPSDTLAFEPVLTRYIGKKDSHTLDFYLSHGGYDAAKRVVRDYKPDEVIDAVKKSGLRGRGGAGFPCGLKWSFVPKKTDKPKYLVCNADESEPGTFKDRVINEEDPHQLLEGILITCWAVGIETAYIYIRGEMWRGAQRLKAAIDEAYAKGYLGKKIFGKKFNLDVTVHRGAGAYICGEETGMLSSLEGGRGYPKLKPPFPAVEGLFRCPTVVNNVETLANLPHIFNRGIEWYRSIGTEESPGPKLFCVSGHVNKPGVYERPLGIPLRELIYDVCGGIPGDRGIRAVIPGGSSAPFLGPDELDTPMSYEGLKDAGSMLGSAGVIVLDDTTDLLSALLNVGKFYHHESCGQCTPCREGCGWVEKILQRMHDGRGRSEDIDLVDEICNQMVGKTICVLSDALAMPAQSVLKKFRPELEKLIAQGRPDVLCELAREPSPAL